MKAFLPTALAVLALGSLGVCALEMMSSPSGDRYVERNVNGESNLPNGRLITPTGQMHQVRPHPYGLTISPDGRWVVSLSSDGPQLSLLDLADPANPKITFIPDEIKKDGGVLDAAFMGVAISPDSKTVYAAGGREWKVYAFDLESRAKLFEINCAHRSEGTDFPIGYLGDMRLSADGKYLYGVDQLFFRMLVIDVEKRAVIHSVQVGRYPFGIALSPDGTKAFVANVGMFEFSYMKDAQGNLAKLDFPPYGVPSEAAEKGVTIDCVIAPPLGDPNDIRAMSVWTADITDPANAKIVDRHKTGHLVGEQLEDFPAVGGSSPNSMAATKDHVYVSNGSNDSITVINLSSGEREADIDLVLDPRVSKFRGMIPFGVALSPDQETLYVAEAGINAIGVVRLADRKVLGHIPTAWFPSKLAVSHDGKTLYAACAKGIGSGPSGGKNHDPNEPTGIGALMRGYINVLPVPEGEGALAEATEKVLNNNVRFGPSSSPRAVNHPVPEPAGAWESPIKHVIYVTKENRTYDEVFGALPGGRGDAELCRLGKAGDVVSKDGTRTVKDVVLMPNHVALARRFAINDNFYCDSDHSVDGHRWLVGTYPNEFMESKIGESSKGEGPGDFAFIGSSGAIYPEDYNEGGAIWEHLERNHISFYNFGLGFEFKPGDEEQEYKYTGIKLPINYPMPQSLFERTSRKFATYNTNIPDQFRMDMFIEEFNDKWVSGKEPLPRFVSVMLPNDHGSGERPDDGYPFWGSYMSDNDLALGRLVELISHSPWWHETVILVTEDDAQGFVDSVDAHRSIAMIISPYAKQDYISHTHTSQASMIKTFFAILGLPPLNQYDAFASDLGDAFTMEPDNSKPYNAVPVNPEVFDPVKAFDPFDREFNWKAINDFVAMDDPEFLDSDENGHSSEQGQRDRD